MPDFIFGQEPAAQEFARRLGIAEPGNVYRIVLDIKADAVAVAYVEMYASKQALEVLTNSPKGIEVKVVDKPVECQHPEANPRAVGTRCPDCGKKLIRSGTGDPWRIDS